MYARQKDELQLNSEKRGRMDRVAALLSYDLEGEELATWMVRNRNHVVTVREGNVYFGRRRSEMATRAYHLDPIEFTNAVRLAGCAVRM